MKKIKVAINGAGRIGRAFLKIAEMKENLEVVAMNDLGNIDNIAYLLKYDSTYGRSDLSIEVGSDKKSLIINGRTVHFVSEKDPSLLPWKEFDVDVVVESTGFFTSFEKARAHITAGAKKVVISAPAKDDPKSDDERTILLGINDVFFDNTTVTSNASCTTNAGSPVMQILHEAIGIEKAILNTVHGYTASQGIVDSPNAKDFKEGRAGAHNIVPTSTGAAIAVTKVIPDLKGKFDGLSIRVPVIAGSIVDITFIAKRPTSVEEVNSILKDASKQDRWKKVFTINEDPIVSSDIVGQPFASIADLGLTRVIDGNLVKVMAWYDNEMGYTHSLVEHVISAGNTIK
jgi:glyceraldehyde 3-phosphate dehydrogenase